MSSKNKTRFTGIPETDRQKKNLLFLNLIKSRATTSRTEVSQMTDINMVTVSNYVNGYLKKGLVYEGGYETSSGGRRPELVAINKRFGYSLGVDVEDDCVKWAISDFGMEIIASNYIKYKDKDNIPGGLLENVSKASKVEAPLVKRAGMAIGKESLTNSVKRTMEEEMKSVVLTGNKALCAAFGEKYSNPVARDAKRVLYLHQDIGHAVFIRNDEFYEAKDDKSSYSYLRPWSSGFHVATDAVIQSALNGDKQAREILRMSGLSLGVRIAYLINLMQPEVVVLGGGVEKAKELFLEPVTLSVNKFILHSMYDSVKIIPAVLGDEACVRGGAFLAIREVFIEG